MEVALKSMSKARGILVAELLEHVHQVLGHVSKLVHRAGYILNQHAGACRHMTKQLKPCAELMEQFKRSIKNAAQGSLQYHASNPMPVTQGIDTHALLYALCKYVSFCQAVELLLHC